MSGRSPLHDGDPPKEIPGTSWFGQSCVKCRVPIHYSYSSEVQGYCAKCTDTIRKQIIEGHRAELERGLIGTKLPEARSGGGARLLLGLLAGGLVVFLAALALSAYQPELWGKLVTGLRDVVGRFRSG